MTTTGTATQNRQSISSPFQLHLALFLILEFLHHDYRPTEQRYRVVQEGPSGSLPFTAI